MNYTINKKWEYTCTSLGHVMDATVRVRLEIRPLSKLTVESC